MHSFLGGCFGAIVGLIGGGLAGIVLAEEFVKPGLDGLVPKLATGGIMGVVFAVIGFKVGKWGAGRQNPTSE
jgi:hypothetical protein